MISLGIGQDPIALQHKHIKQQIDIEKRKKGLANIARNRSPFFHNIQRELENLNVKERHLYQFVQDKMQKLVSLDAQKSYTRKLKQRNRRGQTTHTNRQMAKSYDFRMTQTLQEKTSYRPAKKKRFNTLFTSDVQDTMPSPSQSPQNQFYDNIIDRCASLEGKCNTSYRRIRQTQKFNSFNYSQVQQELSDRRELEETATGPRQLAEILSTKAYNHEMDRKL